MTHLLDSSALFAYLFDEPPGAKVEAIFLDPKNEIGVCAVTAVELWARLKAEGSEDAFAEKWAELTELFDKILKIDLTACLKAVALRKAATKRVPTVDLLIAAVAAVEEVVLVHCDPHFSLIPSELLAQEVVGRL